MCYHHGFSHSLPRTGSQGVLAANNSFKLAVADSFKLAAADSFEVTADLIKPSFKRLQRVIVSFTTTKLPISTGGVLLQQCLLV